MFKFSVFIPTFNAERWIGSCLQSIYSQDYFRDKIEIIVVDGGSFDKTKQIALQYPVRFFYNHKRLAHYAFSIYGKKASGDLAVMFAADNELVGKDWFLTVNDCFENNSELAAVWGRIISGEQDAPVNKYIALIQSEPLSYFTNKNIRYYLAGGKSIISHNKEAKLFRVDLKKPLVWGANGLVLRFNFVNKYFFGNDFIGDNDIFQKMIEDGYNLVAYIPSLNIIHHHVSSVSEWTKKLRRNYIQHFLAHRQSRNMNWAFGKNFFKRLFLWFLYAGIPIFSGVHAIFLAIKSKNKYWLYHPLFSFIQLFTYTQLTLFTREGRDFIKQAILKRLS